MHLEQPERLAGINASLPKPPVGAGALNIHEPSVALTEASSIDRTCPIRALRNWYLTALRPALIAPGIAGRGPVGADEFGAYTSQAKGALGLDRTAPALDVLVSRGH